MSGCFSAITKPLRQHLPAVLVVMGFLQLLHNIWLSDFSHVSGGYHFLFSFFFTFICLVFILQVTNIALIILKYFYFEVKLAYFLLHPVNTYFHHTLFYVVISAGTLATVRLIYIFYF